MKIGYPCINQSLGKKTISTFRISSYSEEKSIKAVSYNLKVLKEILSYNIQHDLLFFRISSDIIPFASHPICKFDWETYFKKDLIWIGQLVKEKKIRISMHPDQFVVLNSPNKEVVKNGIREINYQIAFLDAMRLDNSAKIQIHVGGTYNDKISSLDRFIKNYNTLLSEETRSRVVIENDDHRFSLKDCLVIHDKTNVPILLDVFHHECMNDGHSIQNAISVADKTWKKDKDGVMMMDYSNQEPNYRRGKHANTLEEMKFKSFLLSTIDSDYDLMLEIKDKEKSAIRARHILDQLV
ncbi:MAG: UV DNA damage repair endonuclease UvsE [Nitrosopumilus sp.]|nr:UV DNA damage repair endonuclease UvsE [Nitrosopumilus sp.]